MMIIIEFFGLKKQIVSIMACENSVFFEIVKNLFGKKTPAFLRASFKSVCFCCLKRLTTWSSIPQPAVLRAEPESDRGAEASRESPASCLHQRKDIPELRERLQLLP